MIAFNTVFMLLMAQPVCYGEQQDTERLADIAMATTTVSETLDDAAGLLAIGTAESSWCRSVHQGLRGGGSAIGLWQLEPASHRIQPFAGLSLEDTTHAAGQALWLWHHSYQYGKTLAERFRAYGAQPVGWTGAQKRVNLYWKFYAALGALEYTACVRKACAFT